MESQINIRKTHHKKKMMADTSFFQCGKTVILFDILTLAWQFLVKQKILKFILFLLTDKMFDKVDIV